MTPEDGPVSGSEPRCPVERLLRRFACAAPNDAADRLLAGLTPERVSGELQRAEIARAAWRMLLPSLLLALLGLATLACSLFPSRARRAEAPPSPAAAERSDAFALAAASTGRLEEEARTLALPFSPSHGGK